MIHNLSFSGSLNLSLFSASLLFILKHAWVFVGFFPLCCKDSFDSDIPLAIVLFHGTLKFEKNLSGLPVLAPI